MAPNVFSRVSSASAFELQIKRQTLKKMLALEEHVQGQKCKKDKLLNRSKMRCKCWPTGNVFFTGKTYRKKFSRIQAESREIDLFYIYINS